MILCAIYLIVLFWKIIKLLRLIFKNLKSAMELEETWLPLTLRGRPYHMLKGAYPPQAWWKGSALPYYFIWSSYIILLKKILLKQKQYKIKMISINNKEFFIIHVRGQEVRCIHDPLSFINWFYLLFYFNFDHIGPYTLFWMD